MKFRSAQLALIFLVCGCSSMAALTVREYRRLDGERVLIGQAAPEDAYNCNSIAEEKGKWSTSAWGNEVEAEARLRQAALARAGEIDANFVEMRIPSETSILGFDINAFDDAVVAYYNCSSLPEKI